MKWSSHELAKIVYKHTPKTLLNTLTEELKLLLVQMVGENPINKWWVRIQLIS